ncbi:MAG: EAL domain-containing protein [Pseudomonadota bacterium]
MSPPSLARLALLYVLATGILVAGLGLFFWVEIERTGAAILARERQAARVEVEEALTTLAQRVRSRADTIVQWEETLQQLYHPDYYALWRDDRVRDAGLLGGGLRVVALYDRQGRIFNGVPGPDPMPLELPVATGQAQFLNQGSQGTLLYFVPVHADPAGRVLLGHVGLKVDLADELRHQWMFRYADPARIRFTPAGGARLGLADLPRLAGYEPASDPQSQELQKLFQSALARLSLLVLGTLFLASGLLNYLLVRPLGKLSRRIEALGDPVAGVAIPPSQPLPVLELDKLRLSFDDYHARLSELNASLERSSRDFQDQAHRDALTGVHNRRAFEEDWGKARADRRLGRHVALMLFDCDHFKAINDTYGHAVGDAVIRAIAQGLQAALRAEDRLYRMGGDEFATVLADIDADIAEAVAERCQAHILGHDFRAYGIAEPVTISIGLAISPGSHLDLTELQKRADLAMYTAKRPGNRKIVFYNDEMGDLSALVGNKEINAVFRALHDHHLIEMHYQPVLRLPFMKAEYAEALVRIRDGDNLLNPGAILPIVSARGLDAEFDRAVLAAVARDMDGGLLPPGQGISINLSAAGIVDNQVIETLLSLLAHRGERKVVVEITETALITQMDTASANIRRLREAGALTALDDFGSGYSSLRYLASMPVDLVKFDISMIRMLLEGDPRQRLMLEEIAGLVITAGYELVAEGVENRELLDRVISLGFSHAQGYYFGVPAAAGN